MNTLYDIVFEGKLIQEFDPEQARKLCGGLLKLNPVQLDKLFSGQRVLLRKGLAGADAQKYRGIFNRVGLQVEIIPQTTVQSMPAARQQEPPSSGWSLEPSAQPVSRPSSEWSAEPAAQHSPSVATVPEQSRLNIYGGNESENSENKVVDRPAILGFSLGGRIDRVTFLGAWLTQQVLFFFVFVIGVGSMLFFMFDHVPTGWEILAVLVASSLSWSVAIWLLAASASARLAALRCHDMGKSGWWGMLMFIPMANLVVAIALLSIPGDKGHNLHGWPTEPCSLLRLGLFGGFMVVVSALTKSLAIFALVFRPLWLDVVLLWLQWNSPF